MDLIKVARLALGMGLGYLYDGPRNVRRDCAMFFFSACYTSVTHYTPCGGGCGGVLVPTP